MAFGGGGCEDRYASDDGTELDSFLKEPCEWTDRQTYTQGQTDRRTEKDRQTKTQTDTERQIDTQRQTDTHTHAETDRLRDRHTDAQTEGQTYGMINRRIDVQRTRATRGRVAERGRRRRQKDGQTDKPTDRDFSASSEVVVVCSVE